MHGVSLTITITDELCAQKLCIRIECQQDPHLKPIKPGYLNKYRPVLRRMAADAAHEGPHATFHGNQSLPGITWQDKSLWNLQS